MRHFFSITVTLLALSTQSLTADEIRTTKTVGFEGPVKSAKCFVDGEFCLLWEFNTKGELTHEAFYGSEGKKPTNIEGETIYKYDVQGCLLEYTQKDYINLHPSTTPQKVKPTRAEEIVEVYDNDYARNTRGGERNGPDYSRIEFNNRFYNKYTCNYERYCYNEKHLLTRNLIVKRQEWDGRYHSEEVCYTYNKKGQKTGEKTQDWWCIDKPKNENVKYDSTAYLYNNAGKLDKKIHFLVYYTAATKKKELRETETTNYKYDDNGRLASEALNRSYSPSYLTRYTYFPDGQLESRKHYRITEKDTLTDSLFVYNTKGQMIADKYCKYYYIYNDHNKLVTTLRNEDTLSVYAYDQNDSLIYEKKKHFYTKTWKYNDKGIKTEEKINTIISWDKQREETYTYDDLGRFIHYQNSRGEYVNVSYTPDGFAKMERSYDITITSPKYTLKENLTEVVDIDSNNKREKETTYIRDSYGNPVKRIYKNYVTNTTINTAFEFSYY